MKIVSSFMDDLHLSSGQYHSIMFESTYHHQKFRQLLTDYFSNKKESECTYLQLVDDNGGTLGSRNFYFVNFDCSIISLKEDRNTSKLLQELLFFHLENNADLLNHYLTLNAEVDKFISNIELENDKLLIDFEPSDKSILNLIKSLKINIEYDGNDFVPNYILRDYLIKSLLTLNMRGKEVFLFISFPETDVGVEDYVKVITALKNLHVTTLVVTSNCEYLSAASEENMFLLDKSGSSYDIMKLKQEIMAFNLSKHEEAEHLAKRLAYHDFKEDYLLLNEGLKEFLMSNRL